MIHAFKAEWTRLIRRRVLLGASLVALLVAVGDAAIVMAAAEPAAEVPANGYTPTLQSLEGAGGGTEIFRFAAAFDGTVLFAVLVGLFALEFSRGTYRTMLLRQPRRMPLLIGKLGAMLSFAAIVLAVTELLTWAAARIEAPAFDISTDSWASLAALRHAVTDYSTVLLWLVGYSALGMMVAVLLRSVPLALAVGIAWAGPLEHLVQNAWAPAQRYFPGLLLEVIGQHGTPQVTLSRALSMVAVYIALAAAVATIVFSRRDVTA